MLPHSSLTPGTREGDEEQQDAEEVNDVEIVRVVGEGKCEKDYSSVLLSGCFTTLSQLAGRHGPLLLLAEDKLCTYHA